MSPAQPLHQRIESIDVLRGFIMIIMALDHSRDFFSLAQMFFSPTDIAATTPGYFATRIATNICAPVFIFLTGMGMTLSSKQTTHARSFFLLTRGLWLLFLQLTVMNLLWFFNTDLTQFIRLNVLWAIGWSMICLAGVAYLPRWAMWLFAIATICGHNFLDGVQPEQFGNLSWLWVMIHHPGVLLPWEGMTIHVLYPVVPWCGVITLGYLMGSWIKTAPQVQARFIVVGLCLIALAIILRLGNTYGDPIAWQTYPEAWRSMASFVNGLKYPPSLLYLGLYLAPFIVLLGFILRRQFGPIGHALSTFGQVPFFYYVLHIFLLHLMAVIYFKIFYGDSAWLLTDPIVPSLLSWSEKGVPANIYNPRIDLLQTYIAWIVAVLVLYPACRWFSAIKAKTPKWWMSYL